MPAKKGWTKALSHIYSAKYRHTKEKIFKKYRDWMCKKSQHCYLCLLCKQIQFIRKFNIHAHRVLENSIFTLSHTHAHLCFNSY